MAVDLTTSNSVMNLYEFAPIKRSNLLLAVTCTLVLIVVHVLGEEANLLLRYENSVFQNGEWWRLFSGHFVHNGWTHLLLNLAGIWILYLLFPRLFSPFALSITIPLLAFGASIGLFLFSPDVSWYVGLSGVIHGLIIMGALLCFSSNTKLSIVLLVGVTAKLFLEQVFPDTLMMNHIVNGRIIFDAHLYGAITGAIIIMTHHLVTYATNTMSK